VTADAEPLTWHQALAYAVTGRRYPELGRQERPDLEQVTEFLRPLLADLEPRPPQPVPADLAAGLGPAQLWAAVAELRRRLGVDPSRASTAVADRPLTQEEQRLLRDVPPHHGS
jgi:hypothetical protein